MNKPYVYKRAEDLGIPVVDAKTRLLITVTDDDVVNAKKANSKHCALARAAVRLPMVVAAYFFRSKAFLEYADKMVRFDLPESVRREIVSFDRAHVMASGVYQLAPIRLSIQRATRAIRAAKEKQRRRRQQPTKRHVSTETIAKIAAMEPTPDSTPEQIAFDNQIATVMNRNAGRRIVSGMKRPDAPVPLPPASPTKRYVHRTQYVRDLKEPA